ncbi:DUF3199 family protein, partial [Bacillus pumilus]|uniref:DUF3199 family protein n=1 Tax=Bacillus pumilus TaxID=1408 RepID=UPI0037048F70
MPLLKIPQYFAIFNHHQSIINPFTSQKIPHYSYPNPADQLKPKPYIYPLLLHYIQPSLTPHTTKLNLT